ncbi:MAG: HAD-IA family hydrolase [Candidatus Dojkabacteria bacterium]|nr:MAG: HAD-IA family hydrolase [Candidatus Dojkabacteria bacterium]
MKAIFFDLDNTLYDYDSVDVIATEALFKEFQNDKKMEFEEFNRLYKESKDEIKRELVGSAASHNRILYIQRLTEKVHKTATPERILALYHAYWDTLIENMKLLDGVIELFKYLQDEGLKIIIVTNLTAYIQMRKIKTLGISEYVDDVITSEEAGFDKPHPSNFLLALHQSNLLPADVVMVGDNLLADIEGAKAVEVKTVWFKFGKHGAEEPKNPYQQPDYTVSSHMELMALIKSWREVVTA